MPNEKDNVLQEILADSITLRHLFSCAKEKKDVTIKMKSGAKLRGVMKNVDLRRGWIEIEDPEEQTAIIINLYNIEYINFKLPKGW